jgi:heat shock protein HslJ
VRRTGRLLAALCLAAAMPAAAQTVTGTDWRITALGGAAVPPEAREPVIRFEAGPDSASFTASAGCNRFGGSARIEGEALTFGPARAPAWPARRPSTRPRPRSRTR